jgi:hypothetical protein
MVDGTAERPFVYRTLLPTTVRIFSFICPKGIQSSIATDVDQSGALKLVFSNFGWEASAAYQHFVAAILMFICFVGFGHFATKLTLKACGLRDSLATRSLLATTLILGIFLFFNYDTNIYDPPQLFLFALSLYFLSVSKLWQFIISFALCCINKETAFLLIPIFAVTFYRHSTSRKYWGVLSALSGYYMLVRLSILYVFRFNQGQVSQDHLFRNIFLLLSISLSSPISIWIVPIALCIYRWSEKPDFYKVAFICLVPPLVVVGTLFGNLDEWRIFYEAYPIVFGMALHSLLQLKGNFGLKPAA